MAMKEQNIQGIKLYYKEKQHETADIIINNIKKAQELLETEWGLVMPDDCRVYIMEDFSSFLWQSTPFAYKPLLLLNYLLAKKQYQELWKVAGGFAKQYGSRHVIGIKEKYLIKLEGNEASKDLFVIETSIEDKIANILCHEMTHAATQNQKLPMWLHEGIALIAVDKLLGKDTVKKESIQLFKDYYDAEKEDDMLKFYITGYWITKYLAEAQPEQLKKILNGEETAPEEEELFEQVYKYYTS